MKSWLFLLKKQGNGFGYRELADTQPVIIPPDKSSQLNRILVSLGNLKSGNKDKNILVELSGLLDSLYKNKTIDKKLYKVLWHKTKGLVQKDI